MKLYAARHGETVWNAQDRVSGLTDVELTEKGIAQAKALAVKLEGVKIDLMLVSPLKRAQDTAKIVSEHCGGISIITEERLIEQNYGIYEGIDRFNEAFLQNKRWFAYKYPGGESMMQLAHRIYGLLDEVTVKYSDKNVLLVCHGGVLRAVNTYFKDMTNDEYFNFLLDNCGLIEFEL
ncbi:MAG: histidine phosphatase family protein [Oscillospiraceae bacterium]|nr:histidine phosphatase family protein [Oscillospiraceae bacterium]